MKRHYKIKRKVFYPLTILLIFFMTFILLSLYSKKSNNSILILSKQTFERNIYTALNNTVQKTMEDNLEDILKINKNSNDDILYIDYDLKNTYAYLEKTTKIIKDKLNKTNNFVLQIPFLAGSKNALFNNLGPTLNIKINYINAILTNIYTKVTNYGLNNALVEAYIRITIDGLIITPITENKTSVSYDFLISSKLINGKVPSIYGDYLTSNSSLFDVPINE